MVQLLCLISNLFSFQPMTLTFPYILLSILPGQVGCGTQLLARLKPRDTLKSLGLKFFEGPYYLQFSSLGKKQR